jgi:putative transcriptional regulator
MKADGKARKRRHGGRSVRLKGKTDWKRLAAMKETDVVARARKDRDAKPVSRARLKEFQRVTLTPAEVRTIRRRRGLSQAAFSARYGLNLRTLQDWEQGRAQPDGPARAYLLVIDREPRAVERALAAGSLDKCRRRAGLNLAG